MTLMAATNGTERRAAPIFSHPPSKLPTSFPAFASPNSNCRYAVPFLTALGLAEPRPLFSRTLEALYCRLNHWKVFTITASLLDGYSSVSPTLHRLFGCASRLAAQGEGTIALFHRILLLTRLSNPFLKTFLLAVLEIFFCFGCDLELN